METKRLDFSKKTFTANGKEYHVSENLCIDRFMEFERLQAHVGFGKDFENIYKGLKKAYEHMNTNKLADAAVIVHNLLNGVAHNLEEREHPALQLCALFINYKGEDETIFDADIITEKIDDWRKEGYAIGDFFRYAANLVAGFITVLEETTQTISEQEERLSKSTGKSE